MGKPDKIEADWYRQLASKREPSRPILNDMAENSLRNLDSLIAQGKEERRQRRLERQMRPVDLSERFTVAEVALRLKVKPATVYGWIKDGTIAAEEHGPNGKLKRITQKALEDYLRKV